MSITKQFSKSHLKKKKTDKSKLAWKKTSKFNNSTKYLMPDSYKHHSKAQQRYTLVKIDILNPYCKWRFHGRSSSLQPTITTGLRTQQGAHLSALPVVKPISPKTGGPNFRSTSILTLLNGTSILHEGCIYV